MDWDIVPPNELLGVVDIDLFSELVDHSQNTIGVGVKRVLKTLCDYDKKIPEQLLKDQRRTHLSARYGTIELEIEYIPGDTPAARVDDARLTTQVSWCKGLVARDPNGKSDPFVVLRLEQTGDAEAQQTKTKVQHKTLDPVFQDPPSNFRLNYHAYSKRDCILVAEVWDWDLIGSNDFLGEVRLNVADEFGQRWRARTEGPVTRRYELQDPKGLVPRDREHRDSIGSIEVVLTMHGTDAGSAELHGTTSPSRPSSVRAPRRSTSWDTGSNVSHFTTAWHEPEEAVDESQVVCLLESDGVRLHVHEDGAALLRSLGSAPVAVVCIVGMSHSGKSWLLNQLLRRRSRAGRASIDAFGTADRWGGGQPGVWCAVVEPDAWHCEAMPDARLLLLDTPGYSDVDDVAALRSTQDRRAQQQMDENIFSVALLLSSVLIANTLGPELDDATFEQLYLLSDFAQRMHVSNPESSAASTRSQRRLLAQQMPQLLLLLRDSRLGVSMQASPTIDEEDTTFFLDEQLEAALLGAKQPQFDIYRGSRGDHRLQADSAADVRHMMRRFFLQRHCAALVSPVRQPAQMARLAELGSRELEPEFLDQLDGLRESLWETALPKQLFGRPLTGSLLLELTRTYANDLSRNVVPDLRKAFERAERTVLERAYSDAFAIYREGLDDYCHRREDKWIYECIHEVYVTHDLETTSSSPRSSDIIGTLVPGDVVEALEHATDRAHKQRIRTPRGWVSLASGSTKLMMEVAEIEVRPTIRYADAVKCLHAIDEGLGSSVSGVTKSSHDKKVLIQRCQQLRRQLEANPHATEADTLEWSVERAATLQRNLRAFTQDANSRGTTDDLARTVSLYNPLSGGRRATALYNQMRNLLDELETLTWIQPKVQADQLEVALHRNSQGFGINVASDCTILPFSRTGATSEAQLMGVKEGMQVNGLFAPIQLSCLPSLD